LLQKKLGDFGLKTDGLVGLTSDGASTMVATGKIMDIIHQLCLGRYLYFFFLSFISRSSTERMEPLISNLSATFV
jgi:hypothetical protein